MQPVGPLKRHQKFYPYLLPEVEVDAGNVVRKEVIEVQPRNRLLSQFRAVTCFILADYVVDLVGIEFPLLTIMSAASANSSGIAIANGVDGNAVRREVIGVQASESVVEPVPCIHLLCTHRLRCWTC